MKMYQDLVTRVTGNFPGELNRLSAVGSPESSKEDRLAWVIGTYQGERSGWCRLVMRFFREDFIATEADEEEEFQGLLLLESGAHCADQPDHRINHQLMHYDGDIVRANAPIFRRILLSVLDTRRRIALQQRVKMVNHPCHGDA